MKLAMNIVHNDTSTNLSAFLFSTITNTHMAIMHNSAVGEWAGSAYSV